MEPQSVYTRFESFDFQADRRYVDGVSSLRCLKDGTEELDLKLFFYNKFVEPIDRSAYRRWRSALDPRPPPDGPAAAEPPEQLSFSEVMRLVQEGREVPGVKQLDIQPSNRSPTPSQKARILKPWESAPSCPDNAPGPDTPHRHPPTVLEGSGLGLVE